MCKRGCLLIITCTCWEGEECYRSATVGDLLFKSLLGIDLDTEGRHEVREEDGLVDRRGAESFRMPAEDEEAQLQVRVERNPGRRRR